MIRALSSRVAKWMEQEGVISQEDKALFSYAIYSLLFGLLPIFIVTLLGFAFGMLREGLLMITPFMLIRKFSGGYHLNSSKLCVTLSSALLALTMGLIKLIVQEGYIKNLTVLVSLSVMCLCSFSPVENSARKLTEKEHRLFHKLTSIFSVVSFLVYFVLYKTVRVQYSAAFGVGILLVTGLQLFGILNSLITKVKNYYLF